MHKFRQSGTLKIYAHKATFIPDDTSQDLSIMEIDAVKGFLHNTVKFDEGKVTLSTLIDIVLTDLDFYSYALGINLREFCAGLNSPKEQITVQNERFHDKVDTIEINWAVESDNEDSGKTLEFYARLSGWGKHASPYDMGMAPIIECISVPIVLNENVVAYTSDYSCKESHEHDFGTCGKFNYAQYELGNRKFTLIQVMRAVFFDLTFYGMPGSDEKDHFETEFLKGFDTCDPDSEDVDDDELNAFDIEEDDDNGV